VNYAKTGKYQSRIIFVFFPLFASGKCEFTSGQRDFSQSESVILIAPIIVPRFFQQCLFSILFQRLSNVWMIISNVDSTLIDVVLPAGYSLFYNLYASFRKYLVGGSFESKKCSLLSSVLIIMPCPTHSHKQINLLINLYSVLVILTPFVEHRDFIQTRLGIKQYCLLFYNVNAIQQFIPDSKYA
jgi:hypothetical protein